MDGSKKWQKFLKSGSYRRKLVKYQRLVLNNEPSTSSFVPEATEEATVESEGTLPQACNVSAEAAGEDCVSEEFSVGQDAQAVLEVSIHYSPAGSSDSEQDDNTGDTETLASFLQNWSLNHNIPQTALKPLLNRLSTIDRSLPTDPRRLLGTPRKESQLIQIGGGQYWHQGLGKIALSFCITHN